MQERQFFDELREIRIPSHTLSANGHPVALIWIVRGKTLSVHIENLKLMWGIIDASKARHTIYGVATLGDDGHQNDAHFDYVKELLKRL